MARRTCILVVAAAVLAAGAALAQGAGNQFDPGGDRLVLRAPDGWQPTQEDREEALYQLAFLPAGETLEDWRQKLSVQVFVNLVKSRPNLSPADFTENLVRHWDQACDGSRASPLSAFAEHGYDTAVRLLTCPRKRGGQLGSVSMIKVMRGRASIYLFERSWRGPAFEAGAMPVAQEALDEWAEFLATATLCNPDNSDAPCAEAAP